MDYYKILDVRYSATEEEITSAFYKLIKKNHPDQFPNATAEELKTIHEKCQIITEAYNTLSDKAKKEKYDLDNNIYAKRKLEESPKTNDPQDRNLVDNYVPVDYNMVKKYLDTNYTSIESEQTKMYYMDNKVVAVCKDNIITIYIDSKGEIWSHNGRVMVGIVKNMPVINHDQEKLCDCIMYCGMCGTMDLFSIKFDYYLESCTGISYKKLNRYSLGSIGYYMNRKIIIGNKDLIIDVGPIKQFDEIDGINYGILKENDSYTFNPDEYSKAFLKFKEYNKWYWTYGRFTAGSKEKRHMIDLLREKNYHSLTKTSIRINNVCYANKKLERTENNSEDISEFLNDLIKKLYYPNDEEDRYNTGNINIK